MFWLVYKRAIIESKIPRENRTSVELVKLGKAFDVSHTDVPSGYYLLIVRQNTTN